MKKKYRAVAKELFEPKDFKLIRELINKQRGLVGGLRESLKEEEYLERLGATEIFDEFIGHTDNGKRFWLISPEEYVTNGAKNSNESIEKLN